MAGVHHDIDELGAGSTLGPYELVAPIGAGGMARVWAVRVRGKPDIIALKMLLPELAENVEFRKMFFDEARIASRVRHPNVCGTYEMGEQQGTLYLAMEWLDGPSLMRVLRPGREDVTECDRLPIRPRLAARIIADACAGLHAAHELVGDDGQSLAVVHRDVSPHNLLITSAGDVKITDFGVAKALGKSHMTIAGQLKGKLAYMAPEQLVGGTIDRRCDVFALGCVLYEITTGQRPFQGEHDPQVMASIMLGRYEPPSALVSSYPHELSIIVMRALANEPENRYASADHMRQALESYLRGSGPQVGAAQVAALVAERCGSEMEARAATLRGEALLPNDPGAAAWAPAKSASASGSGAMMIDRHPPRSSRGIVWVVIAALVGASLGIGVLSYVRTTRRARAAVAAAAAEAAPTAYTTPTSAGPSATTSMPAASASVTPASAAAPALAQGRVHLHITPGNAVVIVDGVVLPRGTDTIAKPQDGATMNVLVRADKHEDTIVLVDSATPEDVEVTLVPAARTAGAATVAQVQGATATGQGSPSATSSAVPATTSTGRTRQSAAAKNAAASASSPPVIDAPPNPYE